MSRNRIRKSIGGGGEEYYKCRDKDNYKCKDRHGLNYESDKFKRYEYEGDECQHKREHNN